ncbi:MAG TPA: hypothetical protein VM327_05775 [Candidatus Thermoplasmatota archaeon]|nr:hypothetical protein [Candidatus Thermoplasmatota archaeon]
MAGGFIDIVVLADEPFHASYLATALQLELPGRFRVRHAPRGEPTPAGAVDLVLVQVDPTAAAEAHPMAHLSPAAGRAPVIVAARGRLDLLLVGRLIQEGADDVIDLAQLNTRGLAAAILKAVRRRSRGEAAVPQWAPAAAAVAP